MSSARQIAPDRRNKYLATADAVAALARATPEEAASALRLWQRRRGKTDADLLLTLEVLEREIKAVPEGTLAAFHVAAAPQAPSIQVELYARVLQFFAFFLERTRADVRCEVAISGEYAGYG